MISRQLVEKAIVTLKEVATWAQNASINMFNRVDGIAYCFEQVKEAPDTEEAWRRLGPQIHSDLFIFHQYLYNTASCPEHSSWGERADLIADLGNELLRQDRPDSESRWLPRITNN